MPQVDIDWIGKGKVQARAAAGSNGDPATMIRDAAATAIRIARLGANAMDDILVPFDAKKTVTRWHRLHRRAFMLYFGLDTNPPISMPGVPRHGHVNIVAGRLKTLVSRLDAGIEVNIRGRSGDGASFCGDGRPAFQATGPLANRTFNLCPSWFGIDSPTDRATIMLHELCHAMGSLGFTTDLKNQSGKVVRGSAMTRSFAQKEPRDARRNPENYEEFFNYLIRVPKTIGRHGWKGVWSNLDAALMHPTNGKAYFFKGDKYQRYDFDERKIDRDGKIGRDGWSGLRGPVKAAVLHPNGKAYFFNGSQYQRYDFAERKRDKTGTINRDGWSGLNSGIDAALVNPGDGRAHFFSGVNYRRFDFAKDKVDHRDVIGGSGWRGLAGMFDAALVHPRNGKAYFFLEDVYYRYDFSISNGKDKVDNVRTLS